MELQVCGTFQQPLALLISTPAPITNAPLSSLEDYSPQISVNHIHAHPLLIPWPPSTDSLPSVQDWKGAAAGGCCWPAALQHLPRLLLYLFHHIKHLGRLRSTRRKTVVWHFRKWHHYIFKFLTFPSTDVYGNQFNLPVIACDGMITLYWESSLFPVWTHTCIFMHALLDI